LTGLDASGATEVVLVDFAADGDLSFDASGASRIEGDLQAGGVKVILSGASSASLSGGAEDLTVDASGASTADLGDFPATNVSVIVSGASTATVNASGRLDADASGASRVIYLGGPTLGEVKSSGASTIEAQ
jgi:hypothetical protein